jgi:hypothetical protein
MYVIRMFKVHPLSDFPVRLSPTCLIGLISPLSRPLRPRQA